MSEEDVSNEKSPLDRVYESMTEDPIERAKRIVNSELSELKGEDLEMRLSYDEKKNREPDDIRDFRDDLGSYLIDFGYCESVNEMKRDFYLKNRLSGVERRNMLDFFEVIGKSASHNKLYFGYGVFAVGSSVYSDEYYKKLKEGLLREGISLEDFIVEESGTQWDQYCDFENYEEYFEKCTKENKSRPFDDQLSIISEEGFYKIREKLQKSYSKKKKLKDVLERKGEDLDFVICCDEFNDFDFIGDYSRKKFGEFRRNLKRFSEEAGIKYVEESSYLSGNDYRIFDGVVFRQKGIEDLMDTCRIEFPEGRNFHFYFEDKFTADYKLRYERIRNYSFVQLLRRNNVDDLKETILYGEKTGVYENPRILKFLGRV